MVKRNIKFWKKNPNKWINLLGKNGIVIFPITIFELKSRYKYKTNSPDSEYRIVVKENNKISIGNESLNYKNYIDTWYVALEYKYNEIKTDV